MLVLAGLGNPGAGYAGHRHNMGFMAVDAIGALHRFGAWRKKFQGELAEGEIAGTRILLLKPMTYMNLSGQSVAAALGFYKVAPAALTVFHDEIDLLLGRVKVKVGGGHGGHNGIRDIMAHLGPDFRRVRLGVGHPGEKALVHNHVLQDFTKAERALAAKVIEAVAAEAPRLVAGDDGGFMSRVAFLLAPPKPKKEPRVRADENPVDDEKDPPATPRPRAGEKE
ncbi:MAG TPA: aminoacyl-tRNA hydrolase [Alphaproteobacteria bacterium]|jgi:PTH1 family peptidyl-tRNA hydrolase